MRRLAQSLTVLAAFALPAVGIAQPTSTLDAFVADGPTPLRAIHAKPLAKIGDDVIRFSDIPWKANPIVIEIHRQDSKLARGEAYFLRGSHYIGYQVTGRIEWSMPTADYDKLASAVDLALAKGEPGHAPPLADDEVCVTVDGPGYFSERRRNGKAYYPPRESMSKSCYDPDNDIARLMGQALTTYLNRFTRVLGVDLLPEDGPR